MSDLIRRKDVIKLVNQFVFGVRKEQIYEAKKTFIKYIKKMPTAYDVDNVVEELEKREEHYVEMLDWQGQSAICDAIEIVKQGGVADDVCEWKDEELYGYYTSCTEFRSRIACKDAYWEYCPYCRKKIKAVE